MPYSCAEKSRAYARQHYQDNAVAYKLRAKAHTKRCRAEMRVWLTGYLRDHPCIDCGEDDVIVLEFDHRDRKQKLFNIGSHRALSVSLKTLQAEVAKCDVRCANCHRRKTYYDRVAGAESA